MGKKIDAYSGATIGCIEQFRLAEDCVDAAVEYIETPRLYQTEIDCESSPLRGLFEATAIYDELIDSNAGEQVVVKASKKKAKLMFKTALWLLAGDINVVEARRLGFKAPGEMLGIAIKEYVYLKEYCDEQGDRADFKKYKYKLNLALVIKQFAQKVSTLTEDSASRRQKMYQRVIVHVNSIDRELMSYDDKDELLDLWDRVGGNKAFIHIPQRVGGYSKKKGIITY